MYEIINYFIFFSFVGWVCETIYCSIAEKKFVYRGFLNGPICPVYGFGGLIVVYLLAPFRNNIVLLYLMGMLSCTILEYFTSLILELAFNTRWWDYSERRFNINGRVCLSYSLMFGVLSVLGVKLLYPAATQIMGLIPPPAKIITARVFALIFLVDFAGTVYGLLSFNGTLAALQRNISKFKEELKESELEGRSYQHLGKLLKEEGVLIKESVLSAGEMLTDEEQELLAKYTDKEERLKMISAFHKIQVKRIMQAFPNMRNKKYHSYIQHYKSKFNERRKVTKKDV